MQPQTVQPQAQPVQAMPVGVPLAQGAAVQQPHAIDQPTTTPDHPQDIIRVKNILLDDDNVIEETVPVTIPKINPQADQQSPVREQSFQEQQIKWSTKNGFQVRWDNQWFHIPPGEERLMPRFIAEHFAKHLVDYMLGKEEDAKRKRGLQQSPAERLKLLKQILVKVESHYLSGVQAVSPGEQALQQVNQLNVPQVDDRNTIDAGIVPNPALGVAVTPPTEVEIKPQNPPPVLSEQDREKVDKLIAGRSREDLFKEAESLGIELKGTESPEELVMIISQF